MSVAFAAVSFRMEPLALSIFNLATGYTKDNVWTIVTRPERERERERERELSLIHI